MNALINSATQIPFHLLFDPATLGMAPLPRLSEMVVEKKKIDDLLPLPTLKYKGKTVFITQSLMKDFALMEEGLVCKSKFWHRWFGKTEVDAEASIALKMGQRFEYELCGGKNAKGEVPEPLLTSTKREPSAEQKRITNNAKLANEALKGHGFKVTDAECEACTGRVKRGLWMRYQGISGTLDHLTFRKVGKSLERCIVDFKYSGLLGDKWSPYGWNVEDESKLNHIGKNLLHKTQAVHYTLLYYLRFRKVLPFYFAVFDNRAGKEGEHAIIKMDITEAAMVAHLEEVHRIYRELTTMLKTPSLFVADGDYKQCLKCMVADCALRKGLPEVVAVRV